MSQLYSNDWSVKQQGYTNPHLQYRIVVELNSQSAANRTSNITCKVYQKCDGTGSYYNNSFVYLSLEGNTTNAPTEIVYVPPVNIDENRSETWEEIAALAFTSNYTHKTDGTLSVRFEVVIDHTTSASPAAPVNASLDTGNIVVPQITQQKSTLGTVSDWYCVNTSGTSNMSFTYTASAAADYHKLDVNFAGLTIKSLTPYASGQSISISDSLLTEIFAQIGASGATKRQATVTLTTYDSNDYILGSDSKNFYIIGCGIDIKQGGTWRNGMLWKKVDGSWRCGIVWVNVNGTWKKGIRL